MAGPGSGHRRFKGRTHGIDPGETKTRGKPQQEKKPEARAKDAREGIEPGAEQRTQQKYDPWRVPVGDRENREGQRANNEPKLHGARDAAQEFARQAVTMLEIRYHGIAGEPQRRGGELGDDDDRQNAPGHE